MNKSSHYISTGHTMVSCLARYLLVLFAIVLSGCISVSVIRPVTPLTQQVIEGKGKPKILLINVSGFISENESSDSLNLQKEPSMVSEIRETLQKAEGDGDIASLIIKINSPGGTVSASDIIYHELMKFRERRAIPVYACITGLGTSGAYYIAAAADRVYAHPNAITGSIGVIALKFNIEGLMTKLGIQDETIKSGDKKDIFSPFRPLTTDERAILQGVIDDLHNQFVNAVFAQRKDLLTMDDLKKLADGRIYTARSALELHIIDRIGYMDDVITDIKTSLHIENARVVSYGRDRAYPGTIYSSSPARESSLMDLLGDYSGGQSPVPDVSFLYLWNP